MEQLVLGFIEGPLKGKAIPIKRSLSIGRRGTDIEIDDPKLSQIHAFIQTKNKKQWILVDNNSRNGIRVNGEKIKKVILEPGMSIRIGDSEIVCKIYEGDGKKLPDSLNTWLGAAARLMSNKSIQVGEIDPPMNLRFVEGVQYGTIWELYYGPRLVGGDSLDLCLFEEEMPRDLFIIEALNGEPFLRTKHGHMVRINGQHTDSKVLHDGDIIEFGTSKIRVEQSHD